jgi:hypothetical protein
VKGVLETDALAPLVAELADPEPIVEMLEDAGWKTAWVGPLEAVAPGLDPSTVEPETGGCPQAVVLDALATTVEVAAVEGVAVGMAAGDEYLDSLCLASPSCHPSITGYSGWVPSGPWICGPWVNTGWNLELYDCNHSCIYQRTNSRTETRTAARWNANCSAIITWSQTRTLSFDQTATCTRPTTLPAAHPNRQHCVNFAPCPAQPVSSSGAAFLCSGENATCEPSPSDRIREGQPAPVDPPPGTPGTNP